MRYLMNQEEFEILIGRAEQPVDALPLPPVTVIYFTAGWCGACRRLDIPALEAQFPGINWLKCDIDQNSYTAGFCDIRAIPTFMLIKKGQIIDKLQHSSNAAVAEWIHKNL